MRRNEERANKKRAQGKLKGVSSDIRKGKEPKPVGDLNKAYRQMDRQSKPPKPRTTTATKRKGHDKTKKKPEVTSELSGLGLFFADVAMLFLLNVLIGALVLFYHTWHIETHMAKGIQAL